MGSLPLHINTIYMAFYVYELDVGSSLQDKNYIYVILYIYQIDGLVQERRHSLANALELHLFCTNPSRWGVYLSEQMFVTVFLW